MEADAARFQYSPLTDIRNIRLLDLYSKDAAGIYRGNLREVCLEKADCFEYTAVSYCWGQPRFTDHIICSEGRVH